MQNASDEIRRLIRESPDSLSQIANRAGVKYQPLYRWFHERTTHFNLVTAEAVYYALTGKPLIEGKGVAA